MITERILGIKVNPLTIGKAVLQIKAWIAKGSTYFVSISSVNNIVSALKNHDLMKVQNCADMTTTDGMPLVWVLKLLGYKNIERVSGAEFMPAVLEMAEREGFSNYFYGCTDDVLEALKAKLRKKFPKLQIAGSYSPPFRKLTEEENRQIVDRINEKKPHLVWVGLSTPKQELWMFENRDRLKNCVMLGVGAAFNFITGKAKRAPKWMQDTGLEWLFRLIREPKRLWKRYLIGNTVFIYFILKELLNERLFS